MNPKYIVNEDQGIIVCILKSHGEMFTGVSRCHSIDTFNLVKGKKLAYYRADLLARKSNLEDLLKVKQSVRVSIELSDGKRGEHKIWCNYFADLCRFEKDQRRHIRITKDIIKELSQ